VLAIDHGAARCGAALSDPTGTIVRPLATVAPDPEAVAGLAREEGAEMIVVGLPVSLDGTEGEQAISARTFAEALERVADVAVTTWDERLTTRMAAQSRRSGSRAEEDSLAAAHLLDSWLMASEARR
jgi:putative Holliday junction resolvase